MESQRTSVVLRDLDSPKKDVILRVSPAELKFVDTLALRVYRLPVTIHNLSRGNLKIRFQEPIKPQFKLVLTNMDKLIASGLQMTVMVEYHPDKDENIYDVLHILTGNNVVEIPLIGLIPCCQLSVDSEIDFGKLIANNKVYCREVTVTNQGQLAGRFEAKYPGQLPIVISPTRGIVKAKSSVVIKVDFCADQPRTVNEVINVSLKGEDDKFVTIKAIVVAQIIELLSEKYNTRLESIRFGPVYFGTSKIEHAYLYNNSPEPLNWVAIMQDDSVGAEVGTNIRQRTDVTLTNLSYVYKIKNTDVTTFITCVPNEGKLFPYQKTMITFCFSPKLIIDGKKDFDPTHRQDYAVFLRFESLGSKDGFLRDDKRKNRNERPQRTELAVTGSGLPVLLGFEPGKFFDFAPCQLGDRSDIMCVMQNHSRSLPVTYQFKKTAHFKIEPEKGTIDGGCMQNVTCSFIPHQVGVFKVKQIIEIIGPVADKKFQSTSLKPFHQLYLNFNSVCHASTKSVVMEINTGLSPLVSNPTGHFVAKDTTDQEYPHVAMLRSNMTRVHSHHLDKESTKNALIAFPNDRPASIRPADQDKQFRTIFTKIPRYTYLDPEYEYTDSEKLERENHRNYYTEYIENFRETRLQKQAERDKILPKSEGLKALSTPKLNIPSRVKMGLASPSKSKPVKESSSTKSLNDSNELLSTSKISLRETKSLKRKVIKGLKMYPTTVHEKNDCSITLTPKQLHQVIVGPSVLNFGNVCVNSTNALTLHIINMLSIYILIQLKIDLKELQKTSQLSFVIPSTSSTSVSVIFESSSIGQFLKSFNFTVNGAACGHILTTAVVHPVKIELSSNDLVLKPQGFLVNTCYRGTIRLYNNHNYFARFEWQAVKMKKGIAFSICPVKGTVEPYSFLECEVRWKPGFSSPDKGEFTLVVPDGSTATLKCSVHLAQARVLFLEPRILFSNTAQGLTTWRKAILHNVGQDHAFFKICSHSLLPTIKIFPSEGVIPLGGLTVLDIACTPNVVENFDTRAEISIRRGNIIDLRMSGTVEIADVEIVPNSYEFNATYVGTTDAIPFLVKNKGLTPVRVEFYLDNPHGFGMDFLDKSVEHSDPEIPGMYFVEVKENTNAECAVTFSPLEVATFEFSFHVSINHFKSSELYVEYGLPELPLPEKTMPLIQPCHIQATVLQAPLELSSTEFIFEIPLHSMDTKLPVRRTQDLILYNTSNRDVRWNFDISSADTLFKEGIFSFSLRNGFLPAHAESCISIIFCPGQATKYTADIPLYLNDIPIRYRILSLIGEIKMPKLVFDPPFIFFTPIPLNVSTVVKINIIPENYYRTSVLKVRVPTARLLDGDEICPFSVTFPNENIVKGSRFGSNELVICHLNFSSPKPVSFSSNIVFRDYRNSWFILPVIATAENCILTIYPYMATHFDKQKMVIKNDEILNDILLLSGDGDTDPVTTKRGATDLAKRLFLGVEMTKEKSECKKTEAKDTEDSASAETEMKIEEFFFPEAGTAAYNYFEGVRKAAQTWYSLFGWTEGPHTLSVPESIRRDVYKLQFHSSDVRPKKFIRQNDFSKFNKTIYDVLFNLSGKLLPGVNASQSLPLDPIERTIQLYNQHTSLLEFLNAQGASIAHILPEFLLEPEDYMIWLEISSSTDEVLATNYCVPQKRHPIVIDKNKFEDCSRRSWTDVLLQMYKVLVLSRIVPYTGKNLPFIQEQNSPKVKSHFISSNIYSNSERILLNWMNRNYENARHVIWENSSKGTIPAEKWIVNFDHDLSDGLVLAAQLGAYCPYLNSPYFIDMYPRPTRHEQFMHNCLIVVGALHEIGFEMDVQAGDICEPNPVLMLMLCVYMYERLPTYLPRKVVSFSCNMHETVARQILLTNPSLKLLVYNASIIGRDAANFFLAQEDNIISISPKNQVNITVKYNGCFLHPAEASLVLISKSRTRIGGITMAFALKGEINNFTTYDIMNCKSPCYTCKEVSLNIKNPFHTAGKFNVILVESSTFISSPVQIIESGQFLKQNQGEKVTSSERDIAEDCSPFPNPLRTSIKSAFLREFFCSISSINLAAKGSSLDIFYLPFGVHTRFCVVILSNKKIGEIVHIVKGESSLPLPTRFFPSDVSADLYYSGFPDKEVNPDDPVMYLKCAKNQVLDMEIKLPVTNEAKEKALAFAAQLLMSETEYERRTAMGTLESSSVRVAVTLLGLTEIETTLLMNTSILKKPKSVVYKTEVSLPGHFFIPPRISIPNIPESKQENKIEDFIAVPLRFTPLSSGRYPCKILLTSKYDIRVYSIEGVVNEKYSEATFYFVTRAFESVTQNIPIINDTKKEWKCRASIEGQWFYGPPLFYVEAGKTVQYPITFKPTLECEIKGKLILQNEANGIEHTFELKGIGKKPVALEHIFVNCQVGNLSNRTIMVPNSAKNIVSYKVASDLPIIWGKPVITVQPESLTPYLIQISPWKRGIFKGTISFSVKTRNDDDDFYEEVKEDTECIGKQGSQLFLNLDKKISDYNIDDLRVWYHIEIRSSPCPPVSVMEMKCTALESIFFEIPLSNSENRHLRLDVILSTVALNAPKEVKLPPQEETTYIVQYSPAATGFKEESIIFQPDHSPEFWYLLKLTAQLPRPVVIPEVFCDLGKYLTQVISLVNPTHETLHLTGASTNPENFAIYIKKPTVVVDPYSIAEVPINFSPSALGRTGHQTCIVFHCTQFKEWRFYLSGVGLFPEPLEVERITTLLHLHTSIVIPFQNPTNEDVLVNLILTCREKVCHLVIDHYLQSFLSRSTSFKFSRTLTQTQGIHLPPKGNLDIPVLFIPNVMKLHKTVVIVQVRKANGQNWTIDNFDELSPETKRMMDTNTGEIPSIHWMYPILGLPQAIQHKVPQVVITCQARKRIEEEVEVALGGEFVGQNPIFEPKDFVVTPRRNSENIYEEIIESQIKREFEYEFLFESEVMRRNLESCLAVYLMKKSYDSKTEKIILTFNVVFAPKKPLRTQVILNIECITDGIWKFPITLVADEPEVDFIIDIEGVGLFKESVVDFRLTSRTSKPEPFTAYFQPGSDPVFFVKPMSGELLPYDSDGTVISVGFKPQMYSRKYRASLVIQTADMYLLYEVNGLPPVTTPPINVKAKVDSINKAYDSRPIRQRNFLRENTKVVSTGVSSTIKGMPLMLKKK